MNDSGRAVEKLLERYRLTPDALLVIFDEIDLPLGKVRLRERGGPGTHNGMRSITSEIGEGFPRLRLGVAPADPTVEIGDLAEYVLAPFTADERGAADKMVLRGAEAAEVAVRDGIKRAMDSFNG
jgi:PTH1 family peptidyl-tRNA hydrolase